MLVALVFWVLVAVLGVPLSYYALYLADSILPNDMRWKRRLLIVGISTAFTVPVVALWSGRLSWTYFIVFLIDVLLVRWAYQRGWLSAIARTILWYVLSIMVGVVMILILGIVSYYGFGIRFPL